MNGVQYNDENRNISIAQKERRIHDLFMAGSYRSCLELILECERELSEYSKPILGLYLSIAAICCLKTSDPRAEELSGHAYGINPIFGSPIKIDEQQRSLQAQRIIDFDSAVPEFDWSIKGPTFDENLKRLGDLLGFSSSRPETEGDGTLDVCWVDEEQKVAIGFENKVDKTNKALSKHESDQCSGHLNWLSENYNGYTVHLFVVGELEGYNELATPSANLNHIDVNNIREVSDRVASVHAKKILPEQIDPSLDSESLRIEVLFPFQKVSALPKVKFN